MERVTLLDGTLPVHEAATMFAALGSEQRLAVLRVLVRAGATGLSVGVIGDRSGISGSTLTHHLRQLSQVGLVTQDKRGRRVLCRVEHEGLKRLSEFLLAQCCADVPERPDHG